MAPKKELIAKRVILMNRIQEIFDISQNAIHDQLLRSLFRIKYRDLESLFTEFCDIHLQIVCQTPDTDLNSQENVRKNVDNNYYITIATFEDLFPPTLSPGIPSQSPTESVGTSNARLPKLDLPKFAGNLKEWQNFIDLFNTMVHRKSLDPVEKFNYLSLSLMGEALAVIKPIPRSSANYQVAYDTLVSRYSNKRLMATTHWTALKSYPPLRTDGVKDLRTLLNTFAENLTILENLGFNVIAWDFILVDLVLEKIDPATRKRFELQLNDTELPSYKELTDFLFKQCTALENISHSRSIKASEFGSSVKQVKSSLDSTHSRPSTVVRHPQHKVMVASTGSAPTIPASGSSGVNRALVVKCPICSDTSHNIQRCQKFLDMNPYDRYTSVRGCHLCLNCLRPAHSVSRCLSTSSCYTCNARHHSLLHFDSSRTSCLSSQSNDPVTASVTAVVTTDETPSPSVSACTTTFSQPHHSTKVLLATCCVEIRDSLGNYRHARALVDCGSQASFITDSLSRKLNLARSRANIPVYGLGAESSTTSRGVVLSHIRPLASGQPVLELNLIVLPRICSRLPETFLNSNSLPYSDDIKLADPLWYKPDEIDLLLGADIYPTILKEGIISGESDKPIAINTIFGWILMGPTSHFSTQAVNSLFVSFEPSVDSILKDFWTLEEVPNKLHVSEEDQQAELIFQNNSFRDTNGRFGVTLPFKVSEAPSFENSRQIADSRLTSLERRLVRDPDLNKLYLEFMTDYLSLGHMSLVADIDSLNSYYIPHHGVLKLDSTPPKLRVVFDASCKTSNNLSLNDVLHVGPKLQNNIVSILFRFRLKPIAFTCDIKQMYRQILVHSDHRKYQLIRFRFALEDPISTFQLNTVTYGVSSSPFQAIRVLQQLAEEGKDVYPLASQAIKSDLYVDDFACVSNSVEEALELQSQLCDLLKAGCFELRKWSSNRQELLEHIPPEHRQQSNLEFDKYDTVVKILGLQWQSATDSFSFSVKYGNTSCSKRAILSDIARIYDPLGFLSPVTLFAKRLMQHLWSLGIDWDDLPPSDVRQQWQRFKDELVEINSLKIPRLLPSSGSACEIHVFCDASYVGYASVIYFRVATSDSFDVRFAIARSKVAPLKRISIPRLELCAAVLAADLVAFVVETVATSFSVSRIVAWSDSTVALTWIRSSPHRWKTFVANRVSHIQDIIAPSCWHHISSQDNPADVASRGTFPICLISSLSWWAGPEWLASPHDCWPCADENLPPPEEDLEERKVVLVAHTPSSIISDLLVYHSSLRKVQRVVAYILRFAYNSSHRESRRHGHLVLKELFQALLTIIKSIQSQVFSDIFDKLHRNEQLPKPFRKLNLFIDRLGFLRVGGRLRHSDLSFDQKFPLLIPSNNRFTTLLIECVHRENLHVGLQTLHYLLLQNFWILSGKRCIRSVIANCNRCFRVDPKPLQPPMGDLPSARVTQTKPFLYTGVDFAGPLPIIMSRLRKAPILKSYICLFVCFCTKAVHLELVSDLTSDAFLAALRRFIARRGRCTHLFSDCGTNFIGANRQLRELAQQASAEESIEWSFNPPSAPHFGGLWEAGVKSTKTHLKRVIGDQLLTFEELYTVLVQIEALLNSRPLCPLSSDPSDLIALTPGHLLTLEPLTNVPDVDLTTQSISRLKRWKLVQRIQQDFWRRWHNEYLHTLQQRQKWTRQSVPLDVGTLVLIKNELAPPLHWHLGRVTQLHIGKDGVCRVATVATDKGTMQRPLIKLCPLPTQ